MPSFNKGGGVRPPFGKNQYLRSTRANKFESAMCIADAVNTEEIDGTDTKILQSGEVIARITSGPDSGGHGPFQADATDGRQDTDNIVGINDTFLPWELTERDAPIAVLYDGAVKQEWCFERNAAGERIALTNATRDAIVARSDLAILFK